MRLHHLALTIVAVVSANVPLGKAAEPNLGELTRELTGEKTAVERTAEQWSGIYAQVIDSLMADLGAEDPGKRGGPQGTLERIAFRASRPGAEAERAACAKALAGQLAVANQLAEPARRLVRVWLLRQLERLGRAESVVRVALLLTDPDPIVRDAARRALQKNPAQEANTALLKALDAGGATAWQAALIDALASRRDPANLGALTKAAEADHDEVRTAAVLALSKLGDKSAAAPIAAAMNRGSARAKTIAIDAYLRLAEALVARGDKAAALDIYRKLLAIADRAREPRAPRHTQCAAIIGIGRAGSAGDLPTLFDALAEPDSRLRGACVEALCLLGGPEVTAAIAARARNAKPETKPALLQALARRGDTGSVALFVAAVEDSDEAVQRAGLSGLGAIGNPASVPLMLKAAASGKLQEAARQSLLSLPGAEIDQALVGALAEKDSKVRSEVVRALAARHVVAATRPLIQAAEDSDGGVRNEALRALGVVAPSDALAAVAAVLTKTDDDGTRNEAANALVNIATRDQDIENRTAAILQALAASRGPAKLVLLSALGRIGGPKALEGVRRSLREPDEKVQESAIRALAEWPDAAAAEELLAVARTAASENRQVLAIRGYLRVCRIRAARPEAETAKLLAAGLDAAKRPEEKRQALGGLAEVRDVAALQAVVPCMNQDALREEAAHAAVRIGRDIWHGHPEAVKAALSKVLEVSNNDGLKRDAQETLRRAQQRLEEMKPKK